MPALEGYRAGGAGTVVTASTGNHGAAAAWAARRTDLQAVVYAPVGAARAKVELIEALGAEVRLTGSDLDAAKEEARAFADSAGHPFFEDGAEPAQYEGYGAIADELVEQTDRAPAAVVVPVGNGALLGGIGRRLGELWPETLRVGVVAKAAPVMELSWRAGRPVECDRSETFADGMAVRVAIPYAVGVLAEVADAMLLVSERRIAEAVGAFARAGIRVEGAAGAALAGLWQLDELDGPVVVVVTGRNIDEELHVRAVEEPGTFPD